MEWKVSTDPVSYDQAVRFMEDRVEAVIAGTAPGLVWLLEHPALYTAGTGAQDSDLLDPRFPVHKTGRGGKYTYHGPGQRVAYVIMDLKTLAQPQDIKFYVSTLERWIIATLGWAGIAGRTHPERIGVWTTRPDGAEAKIAAIGVRVRKWVSWHGISINIDPDLSHFSGIVPCGISGFGVTSVSEIIGKPCPVDALDPALREAWGEAFGTV